MPNQKAKPSSQKQISAINAATRVAMSFAPSQDFNKSMRAGTLDKNSARGRRRPACSGLRRITSLRMLYA